MDREKDDFVAYEKTEANYNARLAQIRQRDNIDAKFGYEKINDSRKRVAWLVNFQQSETINTMSKKIVASVDYYFLQPDGKRFKIAFPCKPYLYLGVVAETEFIVSSYLTRKYESIVVSFVEKEDLDLKNHLAGLKSKFLKVEFLSTVEMTTFKQDLMKQIKKNRENFKNSTDYTSLLAKNMGFGARAQFDEPTEQIIEIREYDLPLACRSSIDNKIFAGLWYDVVAMDPQLRVPTIRRNTSIVEPYEPVVCAYDIETTKLPLKFPDSEIDQIIMISYMIDGRGYLICNRQVVAADIEDLEYTPKPEFRGEFTVYNEPNERATIVKFFEHLLKVKPSIMVSYNGDFFDWPFVEARANLYGLNMNEIIGFSKNRDDVYQSTCCLHLDAFAWVKRDSYLPMGSQGLKATTKAKLRYDPVELDPELMVEMAQNQPQVLANYSISDSVATYYLYQKYVHPFIFALCTIIPLAPDDVLRKGSGTLCEALLMTEAFHKNIIFPNKQAEQGHTFTNDGKLIDSETYVGARVEALESGLFRSDIPEKFRLDVERLQYLKDGVAGAMRHTLVAEMGVSMDDLVDFDQVCKQVQESIDVLIANPQRHENPKIYHLDVAAMYPNILTSNRLQPPAIVTDEQCLACVYNTPDAKCKREMNWTWRGELIPASKGEFERIKHRLEEEKHGKPPKPFNQLPKEEQRKLEKKRIGDYCKVAYGKVHITREEKKTSRVCQRENPFYVDTVLAFRDRRYEYKGMLKKAKQALSAIDSNDLAGIKNANARVVLYDSLQLAHKCILNSFYGYVFRKGSRWFSMEMAGIICHTGSMIISDTCELIGRIGRPLELDTDGIWCLLPSAFPEDFAFQTKEGKKVNVSYPGAMLNLLVKDRYTNDQYHYEKEDGTTRIRSENSIFFEVDGPYLAMVLPASKEAGKKLKKRYAVFNTDGSLAELKGFELKRRGELGIIKQFQGEVFKDFLKGSNLMEAYQNVAKEANYWIDILATKGQSLPDEELFGLIAENRSMSKKLADYGSQKSTSITTARRLAEFLGDEMTKNAGLATTFIVSTEPRGAPVTERTIPVAIFQSDVKTRVHFLRKWTKCQSLTAETDVRDLIDWQYYQERLYSCIQKIITIPAALQGIENPVPRVKHPDWLEAEKRKKLDLHLQPRINEFFKKKDPVPKSTNTPKSANRSTQNHSQLLAITGLTPKRSRPDKMALCK